jgi:hypothetical protein
MEVEVTGASTAMQEKNYTLESMRASWGDCSPDIRRQRYERESLSLHTPV